MSFSCRIPVRFADVDSAKIVYYPHVLHYCHVAMEEFYGATVGKPYAEVLSKDRLGFPAVHLDTDFTKTIGYGDAVEVAVDVVRLGTSSVVLRFVGKRLSDGEVAFRSTVTTVCVDMDRFASVPIPPAYRKALSSRIPSSETGGTPPPVSARTKRGRSGEGAAPRR